MKIGIITFNGAHNNGALLQAYALQKYLEKNGHEVKVINYRLPEIAKSYRIIKHRKRRFYLHDRFIYGIKYLKLIFKERYKFDKRDKFEHFINNKLNVTEEYITLNDIRNAKLDFDLLISGSDQVWNYNITKGIKPAFFLDFGNKDAKRLSYAASVGIEEIADEYKEVYQRYLCNLDYISVREESAKKLLSDLTDKDITVVLDPTLLLDAEDYDDICKEPSYDEKYIYYHQIAEDPELIKIAKYVSEKLGVKIVSNLNDKRFNNELDRIPSLDPGEFVGIIKNAEYVVTNSYHATLISLINKKKFITVPHPKYPVRMVNLLNNFDMNYALISKLSDDFNLDDLVFDYDKIYEVINRERKISYDFLNKAISDEKPICEKYFTCKNKFTCYGCTACEKICPKNAISMKEDFEGFIYPSIDPDKCIHCGLCEKTCIYRKSELFNDLDDQKVYAVQNKNPRILQKSTSGGVFSALAEEVLKNKGYIVGVEFDRDMNVVYNIHNDEEYEKFRGAKYVRANVGDIYVKVKDLLEDGNEVLFSGTPCIVAGLKSYLHKKYDNLYLVDIVCHSNSSPKILKNYIKDLEKEEGSKVKSINFRNKSTGWRSSMVTIKFENTSSKNESVYTNNYTANFLLGNMSRPCCYNCEFAFQSRVGDISIGDYWGISGELDDNNGTSVVMVNNKHGMDLFEKVENVLYEETPKENALKKNHKTPITLDTRRYNFFKSLRNGKSLNDTFEEFNTRVGGSMGFGNVMPIFFRTKKNISVLSMCVYKSKIKLFKIKDTQLESKFLFKKGLPFIKGFRFNIYLLKVPIKEINNFEVQNKILVGMTTEDIKYIEHGIGYDLLNLRTGKNRNSKVFIFDNGTVAYFRQSAKNGLYLTVREFHETDLKRNQIKIFIAKVCSLFFFKKDIILLFEKESCKYEESASVLYERLIDLGYKNVYYILDRNYPYINEIDNKYKKKLIKKLSFKHYLYFFKCDKFISTESLAHAVDLRIANRYVVNKFHDHNNKYVFLQHGVMYMISLSSELRKKASKEDKFSKVVVSSQLEAEHFIELGGYDPKDMYICGLAKFDRSVRFDNADKIVIMLTWRRWEYNNARNDFESTKYYKFIERIINNIPNKYKDKIIVLPHPLFLKLVKSSDNGLSKYMPSDDFKYDDILKETKLLITDYSSISYDAFYRGSNVIFCWEEKDECLVNYGESSMLMLNDDNVFGDVCYNTNELSDLVHKNYSDKQDEMYVKRYRQIVEFYDNKNTDRLIDMLKRDKII